ncbi:type VI secretion system baseplate subunit TssE [Polyangium spumosum]|uniref:Type VI secretion system baseplate subunit TssE n=1 Tax=Polyangium spumosum TaxID=889282 RepID=A0A6N7PY66_9BACT|nr:type VI secretion system baseplate subunit TssE [Polyangium spumosum]MRG95816.1 type VI secretion system baseplate subunit TssE [Polyangium spumosum]
MAKAWGSTSAGRVPLFDRLIDENPAQKQEVVPYCTLDRDGLRASVARELGRILGTRSPISGDEALSRPRTTIDYGLPDLELGGRALVPEELRRLVRLVQKTIEAYEPRLQNVRVEIKRREDAPPHARLVVALTATLVTDEVREPLSFEAPLEASSGAA